MEEGVPGGGDDSASSHCASSDADEGDDAGNLPVVYFDDYDGDGSESSGSFLPLGDFVFMLGCVECDAVLCDRAASVILLADGDTLLWSTDLEPAVVETGTAYTFPACACSVRDTTCSACGCRVGYHVVAPCPGCASGANNAHYFLFHDSPVKATPRTTDAGEPLLWADVGPFRAEDQDVADPEFVGGLPPDLTCAICLRAFRDATRLPCGHMFCRLCAWRELDLRKACPLDRLPSTHEATLADPAADARVAALVCSCPNPGCSATPTFGEYAGHTATHTSGA